jgi:hypothetical protein
MTGSTDIERVRSIMDKAELIQGLENINPIISDILDDITLDVHWLCDRLWSAWALIEQYQEEIRESYE